MNKDRYLAGVGDTFFKRRGGVIDNKDDFVIAALGILNILPESILEIGCANGWRLKYLKGNYPDCKCCGIDPSSSAVDAADSSISIMVGTADALPYEASNFDVVIYGFCLYCCDRSDLFKIASEGDRVLKTGGYLVILDFYPDFPQYNVCTDDLHMMTYKMNYGNLFSWHPAYEMVFKHVFIEDDNISRDKVGVLIFHKKGCK
jgi:ubiquinone/menaquinone biosynthesis C-methylase UbiE